MKKFYKIAGVTAIASLCIGIILVVTGLIFGGKHSIHGFSLINTTSKSYTEMDEFDSLEIDVDSARVVIEQGDSYSVKYELAGDDDDIECKVEDGKLYIHNAEDSGFHLFWNWSDDAYITITVPEDTKLQSVYVDTDAGNIKISNIAADKFVIDSDAGNINLDEIESFDLVTVETNAGNVHANGKLAGDCEFKSNCGNVSVDTEYSSDMYSYDVDTSVGHSDVTNGDGDNLSDSDNEGDYNMNVKTDLGNVNLTFK